MPLTPVDDDPFAPQTGAGSLAPVDHDPFALAPTPQQEAFGGRPEDEGMMGALQIGAAPLNKSLDESARSFADFASFGQANKAEAALDAMLNGKSYDENLAGEKAKSEDVGPLTKTTMGLLGLVMSPANKAGEYLAAKTIPQIAGKVGGIATRYGRYAMQGGLLNTLYGATMGNQEDAAKSAAATAGVGAIGMVAPPEGGMPSTIAQEVEKGVTNFAKGAAFGVGGPAAVETAGPIARTIAAPALKRINPEEAFFSKLALAADRQNLSPEQVAAKTGKLGDEGFLANIGGQITDFARDIAAFPGKARQAAVNSFGRQSGSTLGTSGGAVGRVENALDSTLTGEEARATTKALTDLRAKTSSPLWEQLPMSDAPESKVFDVLSKNPEIKKGMAIGIAKERNLANANGEEFDPSAFAKSNITETPKESAAIGPYMERTEGQPLPTFRAWQAGKEGLDDILFSGGKHIVDPLTGQLTGYGRSVAKLRGTLLEEMKLHMPGYQDALDTWSGPTQSMRMIELGQKIAKGDSRITGELMEAMTPNEKDFLRIGYSDQMKYLATKTKDGANIAKSLFGDQNARRNAELIYPDRQSFNQFRSQLAKEAKFHASKQTVLGGSRTAPLIAGMQDAGADVGEVVADAAMHGPAGAATSLVSKGMKWLRSEPEKVRDVGAQYLFSTDAAKKAYALEQLRKIHANGNAFSPIPQNLLNTTPAALNLF